MYIHGVLQPTIQSISRKWMKMERNKLNSNRKNSEKLVPLSWTLLSLSFVFLVGITPRQSCIKSFMMQLRRHLKKHVVFLNFYGTL